MPIVATTVLAALLVAATWTDLRTHRIPNFVSLTGVLLGLVLGFHSNGLQGLGVSCLGLLIGFGAFLPMYMSRAMGAGDVKLMAMVGSFLGPALTVQALLYTLTAGGVLAVIAVLRTDGLRETLSRYAFGIRHLITSFTWLGVRGRDAAAPKLKFPYALAIALGAALALYGPALIRL